MKVSCCFFLSSIVIVEDVCVVSFCFESTDYHVLKMVEFVCFKVGHRMRPPEINVAAAAATSSPSLLSVVIVCMTILAVCAFIYFAIRCYFDERRWRASAMLCKCLPPASSASLVECGNSCRYVEVCLFLRLLFLQH